MSRPQEAQLQTQELHQCPTHLQSVRSRVPSVPGLRSFSQHKVKWWVRTPAEGGPLGRIQQVLKYFPVQAKGAIAWLSSHRPLLHAAVALEKG